MYLVRQRVRQACKRKAEDEPSERPSKLIIKEIDKVGVNELVTQDITSVRQAMYKQRRKIQPTLKKEKHTWYILSILEGMKSI
jgi:hypothetical protein